MSKIKQKWMPLLVTYIIQFVKDLIVDKLVGGIVRGVVGVFTIGLIIAIILIALVHFI